MLDNCEQLLGPASALAERVLRECPGVRILATSREGLGGRGRARVAAAVAAAPDATGRGDHGDERCGGVVHRTRRGGPGDVRARMRRTRRRSRRSVAASTGSRWRSSSPRRGWCRCRRRRSAGCSTSGSGSSPAGGAARWNATRRCGRPSTGRTRCSASANGPCSTGSASSPAASTRAAAQAVVTGDGVEAWDVLDALTELVAKSMVVAEETAEGTTRYQMLETLGQYARERLDEHGDTDRWRRRHAEYFAAWAEEAGPGLEGPDELAWRTRENAELDNLRAAVTWALDRDDPDDIGLALRIIGALAYEATDQPGRGHRGVGRTGPAPRRDHLTAAALRGDRRRRVSPAQPRELRARPGDSHSERSAMACPREPPHPPTPTRRSRSAR